MVLALVAVAAPVLAQEEAPATRLVQIVNADSVAGVVEDGQRVRRLIGNVVLRQDETRLRAQRATQFLDFDVTVFEGDVRIVEDGDTLTARLVRYNSASKTGEAEGDVRIADSSAVLFAPSATYDSRAKTSYFTEGARLVEDDATLTSRRGTYNSRTKVATFDDDVRLTDSTTVLTSRRGIYNTETRRADFAGDVRLEHPDTYLEADSLTHFREVQLSEAHGRVFIERFGDDEQDEGPNEASEADRAPVTNEAAALADSLETPVARDSTLRTLLFGDRAVHDERLGFSRIDGRPLLVTLRTDSTGATDTLLVRARILEAYRLDPASLDSMETAEAERRAAASRAPADSVAVDSVAADSVSVDSATAGDSPGVVGIEGEDEEGSEMDGVSQENEADPIAPRQDIADQQEAELPDVGLDEVAVDSLRARYGDEWEAVADSLFAETPPPDADPELGPSALRPATYDLRPGTEIRRLVARDSVRIVQPDLVAVADSAVLDRYEIPPPETDRPDSIGVAAQEADAEPEPEQRDVLRLF
ncbi:MAG: OstA-like protein, partial [Bacteroidota bacterium]